MLADTQKYMYTEQLHYVNVCAFVKTKKGLMYHLLLIRKKKFSYGLHESSIDSCTRVPVHLNNTRISVVFVRRNDKKKRRRNNQMCSLY